MANNMTHTACERMMTIRAAEMKIAEDFRNNKIFSFYHSSVGQEAVATGVCLALHRDDRVYGNHRSHGHYIAKGGNLYRMFCEIYGKADGCCRGYGGSMHMLDRDAGFMGTTPILGSIAAIATGSAFEQKVSGRQSITAVFIGDGASEEGVVYESINLAAAMNLPVLFVIEDNLFAVNSPASVRRHKLFSRRMVYTGLGARFADADGTDFKSVYTESLRLSNLIRGGKGPAVLHATCYREMAHSGPIMDESVRISDTADVRAQNDPIENMRKYLPLDTFDKMYEDVRNSVDMDFMRALACDNAV